MYYISTLTVNSGTELIKLYIYIYIYKYAIVDLLILHTIYICENVNLFSISNFNTEMFDSIMHGYQLNFWSYFRVKNWTYLNYSSIIITWKFTHRRSRLFSNHEEQQSTLFPIPKKHHGVVLPQSANLGSIILFLILNVIEYCHQSQIHSSQSNSFSIWRCRSFAIYVLITNAFLFDKK